MTPIPNALMIQFLTVVEHGGKADLDSEERAIAISVGLEHGWLSSPTSVSPLGLTFTRPGTAAPEFSPLPIPALLCAVYDQIILGGMKKEKFARLHKIPARSPQVLIPLAAALFGVSV